MKETTKKQKNAARTALLMELFKNLLTNTYDFGLTSGSYQTKVIAHNATSDSEESDAIAFTIV